MVPAAALPTLSKAVSRPSRVTGTHSRTQKPSPPPHNLSLAPWVVGGPPAFSAPGRTSTPGRRDRAGRGGRDQPLREQARQPRRDALRFADVARGLVIAAAHRKQFRPP